MGTEYLIRFGVDELAIAHDDTTMHDCVVSGDWATTQPGFHQVGVGAGKGDSSCWPDHEVGRGARADHAKLIRAAEAGSGTARRNGKCVAGGHRGRTTPQPSEQEGGS